MWLTEKGQRPRNLVLGGVFVRPSRSVFGAGNPSARMVNALTGFQLRGRLPDVRVETRSLWPFRPSSRGCWGLAFIPCEGPVRAARGGSSSGPVCCPIAHQPTVLRESPSAPRSQLRNAGTSLCTRAEAAAPPPRPEAFDATSSWELSLQFSSKFHGLQDGPGNRAREREWEEERAGEGGGRTSRAPDPLRLGLCWPSLQPGPGRGPGRVPASQGHPGGRPGEMPTAGRAPAATRKSNPAHQAVGTATPHGRLRGAAMCAHSCACACACAPITRLCVDMSRPAASQRESPLEAS